MRWASLAPTPLARVKRLASPAAAARATSSGVSSDKMAMPTLGPTPEMAVSSLKQVSSPWVAKPNRSRASSRTFKWVYRVAVSPSRGRARKVPMEVKHLKATPPTSMTATPGSVWANFPVRL